MKTVQMLTPPGRGAIAVVAVEGTDAASIVDRWFVAANRRTLVEQPIDRICFGRWLAGKHGKPDKAAPGEELVVVRTASDRVEVHCHGGVAAPAAVIASLQAEGAVESAEPAYPASLAPTERTAGVLLDQMNGALEQAIGSASAAIEEGRSDVALKIIDELLSRERLGTHLITPWRVVLAGAPNVGKSSLINALVGYDRAIVYDRPGTTRDVVTAATAIDGWPVTLADTAGVRVTDDPLEAAGVELARQTLRRADVVILVDEAAGYSSPTASADRLRLREELPAQAAVIEVASKIDLMTEGGATVVDLPAEVLPTNAPAGEGIAELLAAIAKAFEIECPPVGTAVPFRDRHYDALRSAKASLQRQADEQAVVGLQALLADVKA